MKNPKVKEEEVADWSKLSRDVLVMVLERLSTTDFDRATTVCSEWLSASKGSLRKKNEIPWLILFPYEKSYKNSCRLLNPTENCFVYRSRNLGVEFTQSKCLSTCGSWLLMYTHKLYILNPLTGERIDLPPLDSRILAPYPYPSVFWVDERSKDYIVFRSDVYRLFFSKKGYNFWKTFHYPIHYNAATDFVCKGHLLYIHYVYGSIQIYDFSGDTPVFITTFTYHYYTPPPLYSGDSIMLAKMIVVTSSGEVLKVRCFDLHNSLGFHVWNMNNSTETWELLASLGDEALIFDLGITVSTKDIQGFKPNSIYFSGIDYGTKHIFIYNLATSKVEPFMSPTNKFFDARWFIPRF